MSRSYILLMNRSLLTGLPFLPLCTGVSVHISFCSQESASPQLARRGKPKSLPVAPIVVYLRHSPESCHNVSQRPEQIPKPPTRDSHITMAIKSLDPRKPAAQKNQHSAHEPFPLSSSKAPTHSLRFDRMLISTCEWLRTAVCSSDSGPLLISQFSCPQRSAPGPLHPSQQGLEKTTYQLRNLILSAIPQPSASQHFHQSFPQSHTEGGSPKHSRALIPRLLQQRPVRSSAPARPKTGPRDQNQFRKLTGY